MQKYNFLSYIINNLNGFVFVIVTIFYHTIYFIYKYIKYAFELQI